MFTYKKKEYKTGSHSQKKLFTF